MSANIVVSQYVIGKIVAFSRRDCNTRRDLCVLEDIAAQINEFLQSRYEEAISDDFEFVQFRLQFLETLKMPLIDVSEAWYEFVQTWRSRESYDSSQHFWSTVNNNMRRFRSASRSFDFKIDASLRSLHHTVKCQPEQISALSSPTMSTLVSPTLSQVASPVMSTVASPLKIQEREEGIMPSAPQMRGQLRYHDNVDEDGASSMRQRLAGRGLVYPSTPRGSPRPGVRHLQRNSGIMRPPPAISQSLSLPSGKSVFVVDGIAASSGLSSGLSSGSSSSSSSSADLTEDFGNETDVVDGCWSNGNDIRARVKSPLPDEPVKGIDDTNTWIMVTDEEETVVPSSFEMKLCHTFSTMSSASHANVRSLIADHQNSLTFASGSSSATSSPHISTRKSALTMTLRAVDGR